LVSNLTYIFGCVIGQKNPCESNLEKSIKKKKIITLIFFEMKIIVLRDFQCILFLSYSFDGDLVFSLDMIMTYFLSAHFNLCLCNKKKLSFQNSIISSFFIYNSSIIFNMFPIKFYYNMNNLKILILMLNMALHFRFICNLEKTTITIVQTIHLTMFSPSCHITYTHMI
jgi:hypothetical protein